MCAFPLKAGVFIVAPVSRSTATPHNAERRAGACDIAPAGPARGPNLPPAELPCLPGRELSNREIAKRLVLTPRTARQHTVNIYTKIDARNRAQAKHGLGRGPADHRELSPTGLRAQSRWKSHERTRLGYSATDGRSGRDASVIGKLFARCALREGGKSRLRSRWRATR